MKTRSYSGISSVILGVLCGISIFCFLILGQRCQSAFTLAESLLKCDAIQEALWISLPKIILCSYYIPTISLFSLLCFEVLINTQILSIYMFHYFVSLLVEGGFVKEGCLCPLLRPRLHSLAHNRCLIYIYGLNTTFMVNTIFFVSCTLYINRHILKFLLWLCFLGRRACLQEEKCFIIGNTHTYTYV